MNTFNLAPAGSFCWNSQCADYAKVKAGNIRKYGQTSKGVQRYQCTSCKKVFAETRGTLFHGKHHYQQTILECLAMLADRNSLAAIHRIKGVKEETVCEWLEQAAKQVETVEALLLANYRVERAQLDALWAYVANRGEKGAMLKATNKALSGAARLSS
jgi:transposase-like protein